MAVLFYSLPVVAIILYCVTISAIENIHNNKSCYSNKVIGAILFAYVVFVSLGLLIG